MCSHSVAFQLRIQSVMYHEKTRNKQCAHQNSVFTVTAQLDQTGKHKPPTWFMHKAYLTRLFRLAARYIKSTAPNPLSWFRASQPSFMFRKMLEGLPFSRGFQSQGRQAGSSSETHLWPRLTDHFKIPKGFAQNKANISERMPCSWLMPSFSIVYYGNIKLWVAGSA